MSNEGAYWSGKPGFTRPPDLRSPWQYPPVRRFVQYPGSGFRPATIITTAPASPVNLVFEDHCEFVYVADTGGADALLIYPGRGADAAQTVKGGSVVWIGDGSCSVGYSGNAPTRPVLLIGCNAVTALVFASQNDNGTDSPSAGAAQDTSGVFETPCVHTGLVYTATQVPGSVAGRKQLIQSAPSGGAGAGLPPSDNFADSVLCVAATKAQAETGAGIYVTPGGTQPFTGVCWVCEVGHLDATAELSTFVLYQVLA